MTCWRQIHEITWAGQSRVLWPEWLGGFPGTFFSLVPCQVEGRGLHLAIKAPRGRSASRTYNVRGSPYPISLYISLAYKAAELQDMKTALFLLVLIAIGSCIVAVNALGIYSLSACDLF